MNQITLPVSELKSALAGLGRVIHRKSTLPVLQTLKLSRNSAGRVSLSATDLDAFVTYHVEQPHPGEALDVLLPFEQVNKTVKGANGDVVVIAESKQSVRLRYQIGGSPLEQSIATTAVEEFPPEPKITEPPVTMPETFGETLRQAFETSSTDSSRFVLQGAYLDVEQPACHTIVSTNGRSLYAANSFSFGLKKSLNLMRHKFLAWPGFLEGESQLAVQPDKNSAGWVQLNTPRWTCTIKQIDGQFPKWRQVVPQDTEGWTRVQLSEGALAQMLNLSSKLPGDDTENRTLQLRVGQELHLEGRNKDDKELTSVVIADVKITGKPIATALNREFLQKALRCGLNEIRIHTELEPLVFCNQGKRMIVMPVRLAGQPEAAPKAASKTTPQPTPATTAVPDPPAEERKTDMPENNKPIETAKTAPVQTSTASPALDRVESLKSRVREILGELNDLTASLKAEDKNKRSQEKEIASVRQTLRSLQGVKI
jgi:DNA polymerase III sliding clamp (beta) subunit (PCNA family)